ncbi:hypothetical protein D8911_04950 [Levilactobacillus brevis]|nr:hypothetical protein D8911_04950 [Levilactobacillus brevis]
MVRAGRLLSAKYEPGRGGRRDEPQSGLAASAELIFDGLPATVVIYQQFRLTIGNSWAKIISDRTQWHSVGCFFLPILQTSRKTAF